MVVSKVQKDPRDKDAEFESFVFWVFLNDPNDLEDKCTRLLYDINKHFDANLSHDVLIIACYQARYPWYARIDGAES